MGTVRTQARERRPGGRRRVEADPACVIDQRDSADAESRWEQEGPGWRMAITCGLPEASK
jgi:hypothetical protein